MCRLQRILQHRVGGGRGGGADGRGGGDVGCRGFGARHRAKQAIGTDQGRPGGVERVLAWRDVSWRKQVFGVFAHWVSILDTGGARVSLVTAHFSAFAEGADKSAAVSPARLGHGREEATEKAVWERVSVQLSMHRDGTGQECVCTDVR